MQPYPQQQDPLPNSPMGLAQRKASLIQYLSMRATPYNGTLNIPGTGHQAGLIGVGLTSGAGQQGVPGAANSSVNPSISALANIRGGY